MSQTEIFLHLQGNAMRANRMAWDDRQYAEGLARAICRRPGCDCAVIYRGERPEPVAGPQVLVQIAGPHLEEPVPGLANLLWMISPPNVAPIAVLQRYQAVFIASDYLTQKLRDAGVQAIFLPQATEASHFYPSAAHRMPKTFRWCLSEAMARVSTAGSSLRRCAPGLSLRYGVRAGTASFPPGCGAANGWITTRWRRPMPAPAWC